MDLLATQLSDLTASMSPQGLDTVTYIGQCNFQDSVLLKLSSRLIVDAIDKSSYATSKKGVLSMSCGLSYMIVNGTTSEEVRTKSMIDRQLL